MPPNYEMELCLFYLLTITSIVVDGFWNMDTDQNRPDLDQIYWLQVITLLKFQPKNARFVVKIISSIYEYLKYLKSI